MELKKSIQTLNSSSANIALGHGQAGKMDSQINELYADEVIHESVNEQFRIATEPILWQLEKLHALLADRIDLKTTRKSEATCSYRFTTRRHVH